MTQLATLREHFSRVGVSLTQRDAMSQFGIGRLAPRIPELESEGYQFDRPSIKVESRHGASWVTNYVCTALPVLEGA